MRIGWKLKCTIIIGALSVILAGCTGSTVEMDHSKMNMGGINESSKTTNAQTEKTAVLTGKEFNLVATQSNQEIAPGKTLPVWTFNNSVPGPQIRVKQGDRIKINLKNELPEPVTIHWHGVPVPNNMDGIPGVTQNAVQPGQTYTYEFIADVPGTYWYHSHQDSVNQLDRGLYGSFIVLGTNEEKADRDYTLMLDEWISSGMGMSDMNMSGMDHSGMNMNDGSSSNMNDEMSSMSMGDDMSMYDLFSINGKSGSLVDQLPVKRGEKVRLRLINAGYLSHQIHLHGHEFKVIATDGQPINNPGILKDNLVSIAPGERYDIEFVANNPGQWLIEDHSDNQAALGMRAIIAYEGISAEFDKSNATENLPAVDLAMYGQAGKNTFALDQKYTLEYTMNLNTEMKNGNMVYTINNKTFPDTDALTVKKGDTVKVRLANNSKTEDHPMHLHGHFFQILSKNGEPLQGSPVFKDTLNVRPGEEYVVAFEANNPGNWMFHCHDLHHASAGMVTELKYTDYKTDFVADPNARNRPE
ncbi:Multicopper oxidase with three cupredoxin domains (includes cell division protein FtsP and spore coat protein CotA) [Paenibacillus catalpae]|uniref:Multicopper oxidase with three cupredoxin domains (Includes cell division protein FtsP and spore coat protein CotA) n=1 Tax=Paenibacillus catalpae TaxID=1045775 RepID=A0A1I1XB59_9BACL|nr:multicopper oxidase family protein [Paenibacillus catalpae]SFE02600.1 Multicopper oxidase with three cupredoxin domains (includes cell division protein FtsP and spore coat protein CotA) [Paenibacillus catalpae]